MATVVTKNFKIKTENGFSEPINFLSESVFFRDEKNLDSHLEGLDNKIDKEIKDREEAVGDEKSARESADTALGKRIDTLNTTLTGLIEAEADARDKEDIVINGKIQTLTDNLNTEISEREQSISTLQTTVDENKTNISSLEVFIKGKNTIEENIPGLVDQVAANATKAQENYDAIEALKALVGASSLEEGAPNLLNIINLLESRISVLEGLILTAPDEPGGEGPVEPETPEGGETEEPIV